MATQDSADLQNLLKYWYLPSASGEKCESVLESTFLWLVCLWTLSTTWHLALGSGRFRFYLQSTYSSGKKSILENFGTQPEQNEEKPSFISSAIIYSVLFQILMTAGTANLVRQESPGTFYSNAFALWLTRPPPGSIIAIISLLVDWATYADSARSMIQAEAIFGLLSIWPFAYLAGATRTVHHSTLAEAEAAAVAPGLKLLQAGSAIGVAAWILTVLSLLLLLALPSLRKSTPPNVAKQQRSTFSSICLYFALAQLSASLLVWAGALTIQKSLLAASSPSESSFCLGNGTIARITALWTFVPLLDLIQRGLFYHSRDDGHERGTGGSNSAAGVPAPTTGAEEQNRYHH